MKTFKLISKRCQGLSLIESVVTLAILSIVFISLFKCLNFAVYQNHYRQELEGITNAVDEVFLLDSPRGHFMPPYQRWTYQKELIHQDKLSYQRLIVKAPSQEILYFYRRV